MKYNVSNTKILPQATISFYNNICCFNFSYFCSLPEERSHSRINRSIHASSSPGGCASGPDYKYQTGRKRGRRRRGGKKSKRIHLDGAGCRADDHQPQTRIPGESGWLVRETMLHCLQRIRTDPLATLSSINFLTS